MTRAAPILPPTVADRLLGTEEARRAYNFSAPFHMLVAMVRTHEERLARGEQTMDPVTFLGQMLGRVMLRREAAVEDEARRMLHEAGPIPFTPPTP
jgi:hypothetical protein